MNKMKFRFFLELSQRQNPDFSGKIPTTIFKAIAIILCLTLNFGLGTMNSYAVIDTLRHYDTKTAKYGYFISPVDYPEQYACFEPPAPGYIKSIIVTLGGTSTNASVRMHIYGQEGGGPRPYIQHDLITPIIVHKTVKGIQKIKVDLPVPLQIDNNLFFIKVDNFSSGITLIRDNITHALFCSAPNSGGDYHYQYVGNSQGVVYYSDNAFAIDVIMDYYEGLTSPHYLKDITAAAGIDTALSNKCVSWADINNDHYLDLLVAGKLYKNKGDGTFTDITAGAGINTPAYITTFIDMNNDGWDDILFLHTNKQYNTIYMNNGNETFTKNLLPLSTPNFVGIGCFSIADFNNDSYPDLFVGQSWTIDTAKKEIALPNYLYINDKNLGFTDTSSILYPTGFNNCPAYASQWVDYNDDGKLDLYVANYRLQPDELWKNNGDGTFTDICQSLGIDINSQGGSGHGTGCDWVDYDNDGDMDLLLPQLAHPPYTIDYDHRPTTIYQNNGLPYYDFTDMNPGVNKGLGIEYEETHAGANWGDLNNDGLQDFAICAFYGCRFTDIYIQKPDHHFEMKSFAYGVQNVTAPADLTLVDFDNDGKLDMACGDEQIDNVAKFRLFKNTGPFYNSYVEIDLLSISGNAQGVGAKVIVYAGGKKYTAYQMPYHGTLMSKGNRIHLGLGTASNIDSVVVRWPNGTLNSEKFTGIAINNFNVLTEGGKVFIGMKEETKFLSGISIYPNPATDEITFTYELPSDAEVTLVIYSVIGQKITVLNNDKQTAGQHNVQWNIKDKIAPGLYTCRLQAGETQKTGVLIVQ